MMADHHTELLVQGVDINWLKGTLGRLERKSEMTVIEFEFPTLPSSILTKYWSLHYKIKPMLSTFDALPSIVILAMELAAIAAPPPDEIESTNSPDDWRRYFS